MLANMAMESSKVRLSRTLRGAFAVVKQSFKTMAKDRGLELSGHPSHGKIHHLFLWAMASMAMLNNQMVSWKPIVGPYPIAKSSRWGPLGVQCPKKCLWTSEVVCCFAHHLPKLFRNKNYSLILSSNQWEKDVHGPSKLIAQRAQIDNWIQVVCFVTSYNSVLVRILGKKM
jgi:hypothetical protein